MPKYFDLNRFELQIGYNFLSLIIRYIGVVSSGVIVRDKRGTCSFSTVILLEEQNGGFNFLKYCESIFNIRIRYV